MNVENMAHATSLLVEQVRRMRDEVAQLKAGTVNNALTGWFLSREQYEALDEVRKEVYALLEDLNRSTLPEMLREQDIKTVTIDSLKRRFTVSHRVSCSVLEGQKPAAFDWLRETGNGPLIQETVNASTLSAFAKRRIQEEGMEMPENLFKVTTMALVSATKV